MFLRQLFLLVMYYNNTFKANHIKGLLNNGKNIEESTSHEQ